jgi:hypothetical protein
VNTPGYCCAMTSIIAWKATTWKLRVVENKQVARGAAGGGRGRQRAEAGEGGLWRQGRCGAAGAPREVQQHRS